jgi:hypothetical protein
MVYKADYSALSTPLYSIDIENIAAFSLFRRESILRTLSSLFRVFQVVTGLSLPGVKRSTVTAIECISVDGRSLSPLIIWPASTHRSNWTTYCWIPGPLTQRAAYKVAPPDPPAYQADGPLNMYINVAILIRLNIITSSSDSLHVSHPWMALCVLLIWIHRL